MLRNITVRGQSGSLLWGYHTAATLARWTIHRKYDLKTGTKFAWTLSASIERLDAFQARQRPLLFSAPRAGGFWCWPIESIEIGEHRLVATLGPPEQ